VLGGPEGCSPKYQGNAQQWDAVDPAVPLEIGEVDDDGDDDSVVSAARLVVVDPDAGRDGFLLVMGLV